MATKRVRPSVARFGEELKRAFADNRMVVFLCGPRLSEDKDGARLRRRLMNELESDGFEVVLGEDDGLEALRSRFKGIYAHENELLFIEKECGAIVLIADSVGSFCELGLFAYMQTRAGVGNRDFILIVDEKFKNDASYFNEGPAKAVKHHGLVFYANFSAFDTSELRERLDGRRAVSILDGRGRPAKAA